MNVTRNRLLKLSLVLLLLVVGTAFLYRIFFLHLIKVPTGSMANTIIPGDSLVVRKRAFGKINRGDLIVFKYPRDPSVHYLSRVIGLPGESIEVRGKLVYINGSELAERRVIVSPDYLLEAGMLKELSTEGTGPYRVYYFSGEAGQSGVPTDLETSGFGTHEPFQIPENEYYVLGDNRDNAFDSRNWGTVPQALVFGKPTMIYWSFGRDEAGNESMRWKRIFTKVSNY